LALHRARFTDPVRARREARMRLQKTLDELRSVADQKARTRLILEWQHDTTRLWEVSHAAAPSSLFTDAAWAQLWSEADRALYGGATALPADWLTRADSALQTKRLNSFSAFQLFQPGNLLPFLMVALVYALALPLFADPAADYREGKFADAEKAWRSTVQQDPTDWAARHNLALALAQQDHWDEAAAHTAIAFVQHPRDSSVRWHIGPVFDKAGYVPEALAGFVNPGPVQSLARFASPAEWQLGTILAAIVIAAALALWLCSAYGWGAIWALPTAVTALVFGLLLGAISMLCFHAYGPTADAHAVLAWRSGLLRSIPTDADTTQKTSTLNAGSVAVVNHTFLGWVRLAFPNGQTGWVRKEEVIPIWGAK
jgi:tetratricopeptide (TPR) repeat protein